MERKKGKKDTQSSDENNGSNDQSLNFEKSSESFGQGSDSIQPKPEAKAPSPPTQARAARSPDIATESVSEDLQGLESTSAQLSIASGGAQKDSKDVNPVDITFLAYPGVYEILDVAENRSYYGESVSLWGRMKHHYDGLKKGTHDCKNLQASFTAQGGSIDKFRFLVHASGPQLADVAERVKLQDKLIAENQTRCYNAIPNSKKPEQSEPISVIVIYQNQRYYTTRDAADAAGISKTEIERRIRAGDSRYEVVHIAGEKGAAIFAKTEHTPSLLFPSILASVRAGFAPNESKASRLLKNSADGWRYAEDLINGKRKRNAYQAKPDEIRYEEWCHTNNLSPYSDDAIYKAQKGSLNKNKSKDPS